MFANSKSSLLTSTAWNFSFNVSNDDVNHLDDSLFEHSPTLFSMLESGRDENAQMSIYFSRSVNSQTHKSPKFSAPLLPTRFSSSFFGRNYVSIWKWFVVCSIKKIVFPWWKKCSATANILCFFWYSCYFEGKIGLELDFFTDLAQDLQISCCGVEQLVSCLICKGACVKFKQFANQLLKSFYQL